MKLISELWLLVEVETVVDLQNLQKLKSPKKGGRKVDGHYSLVPDVVLELEQSDAANERGHVVIAIENPNPDLDVKIVVRSSCWQVLTLLFT